MEEEADREWPCPMLADQGDMETAVPAEKYVPRLVAQTDAGPQHRWGLGRVRRPLLSKNSSPCVGMAVQKTATSKVTHTHTHTHKGCVFKIHYFHHHSNSIKYLLLSLYR